jgi:hypothetical protein
VLLLRLSVLVEDGVAIAVFGFLFSTVLMIGEKILMDFSPGITWRPITFHFFIPWTVTASGFWSRM